MTAILGISAYYHDSAAALIVDGGIVAAAQDDRQRERDAALKGVDVHDGQHDPLLQLPRKCHEGRPDDPAGSRLQPAVARVALPGDSAAELPRPRARELGLIIVAP